MRARPTPEAAADSQPAARGATRRRGEQLEKAIFSAVRQELAEVGYADLTIEGIAARAGTSKPVLYRRWPSRAALVFAALQHGLPNDDELPNTGELRTDVLALLRWAAQRFVDIGPDAVWGLMSDTTRDPGLASLVRAHLVGSNRTGLMSTILHRAVARREITADTLSPRIVSLPLDLLRHELLTQGRIDDEAVIEIVDEVFLPLVRHAR